MNLLLPNDCISVPMNNSHPFMIICFDDGNEKYENYINEWMIYGKWKGKVALRNINTPNIFIKSISEWKVIQKI